jgi:hypothetical protein
MRMVKNLIMNQVRMKRCKSNEIIHIIFDEISFRPEHEPWNPTMKQPPPHRIHPVREIFT